uniref:Putative ubiquitin-protein ligase 1 n=1 Tax=Ixodes ricinus TaxID=34613 RepID=A0A6B0U8B3_IXORI
MKAKSSVIAAFLLVLLAECGVGSSEVSKNCGEITMFNVSSIVNGSDLLCLTNTRWTSGDTSHNFSYIGNWTGHDKCLSNWETLRLVALSRCISKPCGFD